MVYHLAQAPGSGNITRVNQPVEMTSRLFNLLAHIIVAVEVEDISDEIEGILVVLNICVEASEVEAVCQVIFVDFAEVFVSA